MKNRFVISENDRRSILSLHGLLIESVETYKFFGKVTNEIDDPVGYCNVVFIDENKILSQIIDNCNIYISSLAKRMYCRMWFLQLNDLSRNVHFEHVGTISL